MTYRTFAIMQNKAKKSKKKKTWKDGKSSRQKCIIKPNQQQMGAE